MSDITDDKLDNEELLCALECCAMNFDEVNTASLEYKAAIRIRDLQECLFQARERIAKLEKQVEWISVEDELPDRGDKYLVILNNGGIHILTWVASYWADGVGTITNVTHWKPLLSPPKD